MDHRPFLPQDQTLGFIRRSEGDYGSFFYVFILSANKKKHIYSNNIQVEDREDFKDMINYDQTVRKCFNYFSFLSAIFLYNGVLSGINYGNKQWMKLLTLCGCFFTTKFFVNNVYLNYYNDISNYYYFKYQNVSVDDVNEVKDPRREFFYLDKSSYYRESSQEIRHKAHHPASQGHDHDTSTYYGPYPYDDHQNLDVVSEISKKFTEGTCAFDNPENEMILNEPIDIKRIVRNLPSGEEYRNI
jgi:hypothetical protein